MDNYEVIVIGGGAAGLMCAITAGQRGRRALVLEGSNRIGKKILMSGGGRCNFTNVHCSPDNFISQNPHFCKSALSGYTPTDFVDLVRSHDIPFHEKTLGQLFCDHTSKDIVALLEKECHAVNVDIRLSSAIDTVETVQDQNHRFRVTSMHGSFTAESLVIACGGLSIPKMGASDFGYRLARQFDLNVIPTRAGLVPFTFTGALKTMSEELSGVSTWVAAEAGGKSFSENILFTHRGLSGPAALQISSYWAPGEAITVDLLPDINAEALLLDAKCAQTKTLLRSLLSHHLSRALTLQLQESLWPSSADIPIGEISDKVLKRIASNLHNWHLKPAATEGYRTAEVTLGGIDTRELSSKTMECKSVPGLFCIGEVVDVTGHLGGFNFQWAWSSGFAAGQVA